MSKIFTSGAIKIIASGTVECIDGNKKKLTKSELDKKINRIEIIESDSFDIKLDRVTVNDRKKIEEKSAEHRKENVNLNTRTLRKRKSDHIIEPPKKRARLNTVVKSNQNPKFISTEPCKIKKKSIVLAHMRTYSPWPACVIELNEKTVKVKFFGDDTVGTVKIENIGLIHENEILIKSLLNKKIPNYRKAIAEVEVVLKVPSDLSLL